MTRESWRLPDAQPFRVVDHCWIPMPDGVRLSARLWLPEDTPAPVVLEYIPYRKSDRYRALDDYWGRALAARGIAFARADVRGTGDSEGVMTDEYSELELADGVACIAWLSEQGWSNGNVGMRGISWGGINALQIAALKPSALKAIMPMCCCDNRFTGDAHYLGGALGHTNFQWGTLFKLVMAGPPSPAIVGEEWERLWRQRLEATPSILATWTSHQHFDGYWQRGSVAIDYSAITCPVYIVGGLADSYSDSLSRLLENLSVPRKGLIGPWGHTYPYAAEPGLDWAHEEVRWWQHWLMGINTGLLDEPMFRVFMPYATASETTSGAIDGRWVAEDCWPSRAIMHRRLHLNREGLSEKAGPEAALEYVGDRIVGTTKPEWLDRLPVEQSRDDDRSLVFDSLTLVDDLEMLGMPVASLRLSADKPVAKIALRLCDVAPDGRSWLVTYAIRNLAHRDSHSAPSALQPRKFYDVSVPLGFAAHRFRKGHRIRVAISESLWPLVWPSPEPVTLSIVAGASSLVLPIRPIEAVAASMPIPEKRSARTAPQAFSGYTTEPGSSGRYSLCNDQPPETQAVNGVRITRERHERSEISEGQSDCRWSQESLMTWAFDGMECRLDAGYALSCAATVFRLSECLIARRNGNIVFERRTQHDIPRDLV